MNGVFRVDKIKTTHDIYGVEKHVERRADKSNTNPQIDHSQSSKNYDLSGKFDESLVRLLKKRLKETGNSKHRKDAVLLSAMMFSASHDFFKNMSDDEIRQYFQNCYNWVAQKYGEDNILSAVVHLDETTPHMHLFLVPITDRGTLAHNSLFDGKAKMKALQDEVHQEIFQAYGLERGQPKEETQRKHLTTYEWKKQQAEKMKDLSEEIDKARQEKTKLEQQISELEQQRDSDLLYKTRQHLSAVTSRLNEMMSTIESDPDLMKYYKLVSQKQKDAQNRNMSERDI